MKSFLRRLFLGSLLALALVPGWAQTPPAMVRLHTTQGLIDMKFLDGAPVTVANFLTYLRAGDYNDVFFHRSAWNGASPFVIQAGGFRWTTAGGITAVTTRPPIVNEFSPQRSNVQGTVAMAKLKDLPDSATSQWFINMANNAFLDSSPGSGGYTVFARVTMPGMITAGKISSLTRVNLSSYISALNEMPVQGWAQGTPHVNREHAVLISEARELTTTTEADRLFNFLEAQFPTYLSPQKGTRGEWGGYKYSYYVGTNTFVGVKDETVWYYMPSISEAINPLGPQDYWWAQAQAAGY